jgi:hypothetical protein
MNMLNLVLLGLSILVIVGIMAWLVNRTRQFDITPTSDDKPEWMRSNPPRETIVATKVQGAGVGLYGQEEGEQLASPFAEQIEDILRAELAKDPELAALKVDLGTAKDGGLEIWVDGESYSDLETLPNKHLREAIRRASQKWQKDK